MPDLDRPDGVPSAGPEIWIRRLKANERVNVGLCSPAIWQFWTHWNCHAGPKGRSEPCWKNHKECPGHKAGHPRRWKGYIFVVNERKRRAEFLEITPVGAADIMAQVGKDETLRGLRFSVVRGGGDAARLEVNRLSDWDKFTATELPPDKDPIRTLAKFWGLADLDVNQAKPTGIVLDG